MVNLKCAFYYYYIYKLTKTILYSYIREINMYARASMRISSLLYMHIIKISYLQIPFTYCFL